ncbi:hypothetical protein PPERSA_03965 [Pseudocohnilembus persalinus]|uniref:Uncharacterized protein n=1 Tax=Pseudocohnilembus persalinus TaxID=266149 RepID=A0A0V0QAR9_PSEPJ|nr:hypothetical protein PPERSA_03965 [Pseudocohnilembus persalinus]|eukprot:KRW99259.1 hypothetical protein PPERSA_03965 [Pseudocohnilembus persalinus]
MVQHYKLQQQQDQTNENKINSEIQNNLTNIQQQKEREGQDNEKHDDLLQNGEEDQKIEEYQQQGQDQEFQSENKITENLEASQLSNENIQLGSQPEIMEKED